MKIFRNALPFLIFVFLLGNVKTVVSQSNESENIVVSEIDQYKDATNFNYPQGEYETFDDFVAIKPTMDINFEKTQLKNILSTNFQLFYDDGQRVKKPFAVSNGKELFIRVKHFKKQMKSKYKGQPSDANRDYMLAYLLSKDFLYFENEFISDYGVLARFVRYGILYDCSSKEFIVLDRNVKLNNFIEQSFPEFKTEFVFTSKRPDLKKVRQLMIKIFTTK